MKDANEQSQPCDQQEMSVEAGMVVLADKKNKSDNIFKAIDQQALEKGFKERDFEIKERQDVENLRMAVEFIKH